MNLLGTIHCGPPALLVGNPAPPPLNIEHHVRVSALEPEHLWKLHGDTLLMGTEGKPDIAIPLASITKLRLAYEPNRMQLNRYRCYLYNASGKIATIQNAHFEDFATFQDRSSTYIPIVHALIPRIASLSRNCQFFTGVSMLRWLLNAIFFGIVGIVMLLTAIFFYTAIGWLVVLKLLIIAIFIPAVIRWFLKNKPQTFEPQVIPESLLPS